MATLRIKNETAAELQLQTGGAPLKLAAGGEADLSENELVGKGVATALSNGSISFVPVANPEKEKIALAEKVLPPLVASIGGRITNARNRFTESQKNLLKLRGGFNQSWHAAESHLTAAQSAALGWPGLRKAVKNLLLDTRPDDPDVTKLKDDIKALETDIDTLNTEDLQNTGRTLQQWFAGRMAKEQALKQAHEDLAKLGAKKTGPLSTEVASVDASVSVITGMTQDKAIGKALPEFGK